MNAGALPTYAAQRNWEVPGTAYPIAGQTARKFTPGDTATLEAASERGRGGALAADIEPPDSAQSNPHRQGTASARHSLERAFHAC